MDIKFEKNGGLKFVFKNPTEACLSPDPDLEQAVYLEKPSMHELRKLKDQIISEIDRRWSLNGV